MRCCVGEELGDVEEGGGDGVVAAEGARCHFAFVWFGVTAAQ